YVAAREPDRDVARLLDDVVVGDDVAVLGVDDPRTEPASETGHRRGVTAADVDAYHRRGHGLRDGGHDRLAVVRVDRRGRWRVVAVRRLRHTFGDTVGRVVGGLVEPTGDREHEHRAHDTAQYGGHPAAQQPRRPGGTRTYLSGPRGVVA